MFKKKRQTGNFVANILIDRTEIQIYDMQK